MLSKKKRINVHEEEIYWLKLNSEFLNFIKIYTIETFFDFALLRKVSLGLIKSLRNVRLI